MLSTSVRSIHSEGVYFIFGFTLRIYFPHIIGYPSMYCSMFTMCQKWSKKGEIVGAISCHFVLEIVVRNNMGLIVRFLSRRMLYSTMKFEELHRGTSALQRRKRCISRRKCTEKIVKEMTPSNYC